MRVGAVALVAGLLSFGLVACGSSPAAAKPASTPKPSGTANVAYAASIENLNEKVIGPDFTSKTGYRYQGRGAGAKALSAEIASGEIAPNVFESVGGKPIEALEPRFTSWYVQFAGSPIVLAYNPQSRYAGQFEAIARGSKPISSLFTLLETPGLKLGRTDPNVDPQGEAFIEMLMLAEQTYNLPSDTVQKILGAPPSSSSSPEIFDEAAVLPRLQAGQLDCSSAYLSEAVQLHLRYITLPSSINLGDPARAAAYARARFTLASGEAVTGAPLVIDITTVGDTDTAAAEAFVAYVLSSKGLALHKQGGYTLLKPTIFGRRSAVPAAVRAEIGG